MQIFETLLTTIESCQSIIRIKIKYSNDRGKTGITNNTEHEMSKIQDTKKQKQMNNLDITKNSKYVLGAPVMFSSTGFLGTSTELQIKCHIPDRRER